MTLTPEQIATAFSRHEFESAIPHLADDVTWTTIGGERLAGREAVTTACRQSAVYLAGVATTFDRFIVRAMPEAIVIESTATYTEPDGTTATIASCDIYDFHTGALRGVTSYTIALPDAA